MDDLKVVTAATRLRALRAQLSLLDFEHHSASSQLAPTSQMHIGLAQLAAAALDQLGLERGDKDIAQLCQDAPAVVGELNVMLASADVGELLVTSYIGFGVLHDLQVVLGGVKDRNAETLLHTWLAQMCDGDPVLAARLALWARRVAGEAFRTCAEVVSEPVIHDFVLARFGGKHDADAKGGAARSGVAASGSMRGGGLSHEGVVPDSGPQARVPAGSDAQDRTTADSAFALISSQLAAQHARRMGTLGFAA